MLRTKLLRVFGSTVLGTAALSAVVSAAVTGAPAATAAARPDSTGPAGTWASGPPLPLEGQTDVAALSCGTPTFCAAVDGFEGAWTYLKGKWSYDAHISDDSNLIALQCFSNQTCVGTDDQAHLVTYRNGAWSVSTGYFTNNGGTEVSCGSPDFCLFVSNAAQFYVWNGKTFSSPTVPDEPLAKALNADGEGEAYVTCAAGTTSCVMADTLGNVATYKAGVWSALTKLPSFSSESGVLVGPSCVSAADCLFPVEISHAVDGMKWAVYNGKDWKVVSGGTDGYPYANGSVGTMSCVPGFCMGLDTVGVVPLRGFIFNGKAWSVTGFFGDNTVEPNMVSCASPKWCMAVDTAAGSATAPTWIFHPSAA